MRETMEKNTLERLFRGKKYLWLALLAAVGVALMLMGGGTSSDKKESTEVDSEQKLARYTAALRNDIEQLCRQVGGVSDVTVAVSLECGFEYVYATDQSLEFGAGGGEQIKYITVGNGSSESAVYITEKLPRIGGVGIVCRGGSDPEVVRRLTSLISAAYNIGSNKIYVTGT